MDAATLRRHLRALRPARVDGGELRRAAVLVPFVAREDGGLDVLLEKRPEHARVHPGQISFPGGRVEPGDRDAADTALRETEEELGIPRSAIEVLGELDGVITSSRFAVVPIAGYLAARPQLELAAAEVSAALYVPFEVFLSGETREVVDLETRKGVIFFRHGGETVWGATARILDQLVARLAER